MVALQRAVDAALADLFPPERRFMSHLTLARVKAVPDRERLRAALPGFRVPALAFPVERFILKRSLLTPAGPQYSDLESYPATAAAGTPPARSAPQGSRP